MNDFVIDLGSEYTRILRAGQGLVLEEATLARISRTETKTVLLEKGNIIKSIVQSREANEFIIAPIKRGCIVDEAAAFLLYASFMQELIQDTAMKTARIIALVHCGMSEPERHIVRNIFTGMNIGQAVVTDNALAAYAYLNKDAAFTINIGAEIIDIAATDKTGIIRGCSADIAGRSINNAIAKYIENSRGVVISAKTAEKLKLSIGGLADRPDESIAVAVPSIIDPASETKMTIKANELGGVIALEANKMAELIESMLASLPPRDFNRICLSGIYMMGGTAKLLGLPQFISEKLKLRIYLVKNGMRAPVLGGEKLFA